MTRMPAWITTAPVVRAINILSRLSSIASPAWNPTQACLDTYSPGLCLRSASFRGRGFVIRLPSSLICRLELFLLLADHVASAIDPVAGLVASLAGTVADVLAAFLGLRAKHVTRLFAG